MRLVSGIVMFMSPRVSGMITASGQGVIDIIASKPKGNHHPLPRTAGKCLGHC